MRILSMADHQPDSRTLNFAGDVDDQGYSLPMTIDVLRRRTEKWPVSPRTPERLPGSWRVRRPIRFPARRSAPAGRPPSSRSAGIDTVTHAGPGAAEAEWRYANAV
jgi:hypothetical protein